MAYTITLENETDHGFVKRVLGRVDTLKEAESLVEEIEAQWSKWTGEEPVDPVIRDFEGCDIYATDSKTGKVYCYVDTWEEMP